MDNVLLAAKLFRITSHERVDLGKAEELIGLSTGLQLCRKACEYPEASQEIISFNTVQSKSLNKSLAFSAY